MQGNKSMSKIYGPCFSQSGSIGGRKTQDSSGSDHTAIGKQQQRVCTCANICMHVWCTGKGTCHGYSIIHSLLPEGNN
jgi:hypothetical protein